MQRHPVYVQTRNKTSIICAAALLLCGSIMTTGAFIDFVETDSSTDNSFYWPFIGPPLLVLSLLIIAAAIIALITQKDLGAFIFSTTVSSVSLIYLFLMWLALKYSLLEGLAPSKYPYETWARLGPGLFVMLASAIPAVAVSITGLVASLKQSGVNPPY